MCKMNLDSLNVLISYNVLIKWLQKVNPLTALSTYRLTALVKSISRRFCEGVDFLKPFKEYIVRDQSAPIMFRNPRIWQLKSALRIGSVGRRFFRVLMPGAVVGYLPHLVFRAKPFWYNLDRCSPLQIRETLTRKTGIFCFPEDHLEEYAWFQ